MAASVSRIVAISAQVKGEMPAPTAKMRYRLREDSVMSSSGRVLAQLA